MNKYILNENGKPVPCDNLHTWAVWFENSNNKRVVAKTHVGTSIVSTVFLALDHSFEGGEPILWETLVMGGKMDKEMNRCGGSREQAEAMHEAVVTMVRAVTSPYDYAVGWIGRHPAFLQLFVASWNIGACLFNYHDHAHGLAIVNALCAGFCLATAFWIALKPGRFRFR